MNITVVTCSETINLMEFTKSNCCLPFIKLIHSLQGLAPYFGVTSRNGQEFEMKQQCPMKEHVWVTIKSFNFVDITNQYQLQRLNKFCNRLLTTLWGILINGQIGVVIVELFSRTLSYYSKEHYITY